MLERVSEEQAIGYEGVHVGMEVEVFAEGVERHDDAGDAFGAVQGGAEVLGEALMREGAKAFQEAAVALEVRAEHARDGQDVVPVRHGSQYMVEDEPGGGLDVFLVAGGAEPAALAGEGQQIFVFAMVAANAGEAARQVAAIEILVDHFRNDGAQQAVTGLVLFGVDLFEVVVVAVCTLPEGRHFGISGAIGLHGIEL